VNKLYITPGQLLEDSFALGWQVFASGFRPTCVVGVWRGGSPVAIAVHELLHILGVPADHIAVRTASYTGIGERGAAVQVEGLDYLSEGFSAGDALLLVDDVYDTGLSLQRLTGDLRIRRGADTPQLRIATPYYKPGRNRTGREPDYFVHRTDDWLVFPHELEGLSIAELRAHKPELVPFIDELAAHLAH
jgi:hypoxanthine phosphoribosyltransferase